MATGLADIMSSVLGEGDRAPGVDDKQYKGIQDDARYESSGLYQRGREYKVDAPDIQNKYQDESRGKVDSNIGEQRYLGQHLRDIQEGRDVTGSQAVMQQGIDKSIAAQMGAARSARGASGQGAAMRGAQQQAAEMQGSAANNAAILQSQMAADAARTEAGVRAAIGQQVQAQYGLEQGSAIEQARMQQEAEAQRQRMELGLTGLSQNARGQQLGALNSMTQAQQGQFGQQQQANQAAQEGAGGILGSGIGAAAGAMMMMSDDKAKSTQPSFAPVDMGGGKHKGTGDAFSAGFSGGMKLGQGVGSMFSSSAPAVGSDAWASQVNSQPTMDYKPMSGPAATPLDPSAPAGTNTPAWLQDYMSSGEADKMSDGQKMQMASSIASMFKSDEEAKLNKREASRDGRHVVDQFMDSLEPLAYYYKDPADEPRQPATGGKYIGISAQDAERAPKVGRQIVVDTPDGPIEYWRAYTMYATSYAAKFLVESRSSRATCYLRLVRSVLTGFFGVGRRELVRIGASIGSSLMLSTSAQQRKPVE